jgi:hypothetical protein
MGARLCWFAVKGVSRTAALEDLELEVHGEPVDDLPHRLGVGTLPEDWLLFVFNDDLKAAFEDRFIALSRHGPAVACAIEEHVMFQEARGYAAGAEIWRITHDPNKGRSLYHLEVAGEPPASLEATRRQAIAEQDAEGGEDAGVDLICDVPLDIARSICGFKHDDEWPDGLQFTELRRVGAAKASSGPGFLQRLFRRG